LVETVQTSSCIATRVRLYFAPTGKKFELQCGHYRFCVRPYSWLSRGTSYGSIKKGIDSLSSSSFHFTVREQPLTPFSEHPQATYEYVHTPTCRSKIVNSKNV